ncbi:MAG TPA: hypothetical protein ENJ60_12965 [Aeromonadales bacterium]|nr:hypothetical protein [Aeromonadales bacterium]
MIAILIIGTLLGFYFSSSVMMQLHNTQFMIFEALVSGTLLHVLYHQPGHEHHHHNNDETNAEHKQRWNKNSLMGAVIAVVLLIILTNITRIH